MGNITFLSFQCYSGNFFFCSSTSKDLIKFLFILSILWIGTRGAIPSLTSDYSISVLRIWTFLISALAPYMASDCFSLCFLSFANLDVGRIIKLLFSSVSLFSGSLSLVNISIKIGLASRAAQSLLTVADISEWAWKRLLPLSSEKLYASLKRLRKRRSTYF